MRIEIKLPFPPSINSIWRGGRGRVFRSQKYLDWISEADICWFLQKPKGRFKGLVGRFSVTIFLTPPNKHSRDIDNFSFKAVLDWCARAQIISNDSYAQKICAEWANDRDGPCVRVILQSVD